MKKAIVMKSYRFSDFNTEVDRYERWYERNKLAYHSEINAIKKLIPEGIGLEVGVGTGRFASALGIPYGIDPANESLNISYQRGINVARAVGEKLPFKDKSFDFTMIIVAISFLQNPQQVLYEMNRVLKERGKIIVGIVDKDSFLGELYQEKGKAGHLFYRHATLYTPLEVIDFLKESKFKNFKTYQTIFQLPGNLKDIEQPLEGYGKGGFVVIGAEKAINNTEISGGI